GGARAGRAQADPVSRRLRVFRARSDQRVVGPAEELGWRRPAHRGRISGVGPRVLGDPRQLIWKTPMADNDDPFMRPDATLIRPRPGGAKRSPGEPARPRPATRSFTESDQIPVAARTLLGIGLNPLVQAASLLLMLAG